MLPDRAAASMNRHSSSRLAAVTALRAVMRLPLLASAPPAGAA
jgi:hypothetical protein